MQVIGLDEIRDVVDHEVAHEAVRSALEALAEGGVVAGEAEMTLAPAGVVHLKGAHLDGEQWIVCKVATGGFEGGIGGGCSLLLDSADGRARATLVDDGWLTHMRTAAAGALASDLLANPGPVRVAVLGTGTQSGLQIEALRLRREVTELRVWGRRMERAEAVADAHDGQAFERLRDAVDGADIVVTCTSAYSPVLSIDHLDPGTHVTAIGADAVGKRELDIGFGDGAGVLVGDDLENRARIGELRYLPRAVRDRALSFAALATGQVEGRHDPTEVTLADLCGIGAYDAAIARRVACAYIDRPTEGSAC